MAMETGAFAMFDALGIRGIWKRYDPEQVITKFENLQRQFQTFVDGQLGGEGHPNTKDPGNGIKRVRVGFVSDTAVIAFTMKKGETPPFAVMMAARWASQFARLALRVPPAWTYRGVVTYGEFAISEQGTYFVGPAVDEAADNYERANACLIWLAPSARKTLAQADWSHFSQGALTLREHDVPLKAHRGDAAGPYRTYVASPFDSPDSEADAQRLSDEILGTFDLTRPDVREKHRNTETFLRRALDDYRVLLDWQIRAVAHGMPHGPPPF
jgi:hypothetical protein